MKLYLINQYKAYMAAECGVVAVTEPPVNTAYYEAEILQESDVELPAGYTMENDKVCFEKENADIVTERDGDIYKTMLVTSHGIDVIKLWHI